MWKTLLYVHILFTIAKGQDDKGLKEASFFVDTISLMCQMWIPGQQSMFNQTVTADKINVLYYTGGQFETYSLLNASESIIRHPTFKSGLKTAIYTHGFNGDPKSESNTQLASSMVAKNYNYLALDATAFLKVFDYRYSAGSVPYIGTLLFKFISELYQKGYAYENIYLIGESLGAQISSVAAKKFKQTQGRTLNRITGLDPAAPCFKSPDYISTDDAVYVDVIFSSMLSYTSGVIGHAQYFPNNMFGMQPGCGTFPIPDVFCSHKKAKAYYLESVNNPVGFVAKKCANMISNCSASDVSYMGFMSSPTTRGNYFLKTNENPPFAMGNAGIL